MALPKELSVDSSPTPDWLRHSELLNAALGYAALGWRVFPIRCPVFTAFGVRCSCNKKDCRNPGKHSHILNFQSAASTNHNTIEGWWKERPDANIGIVTGRTSRIVVLDVDPRNGGGESLAELIKKYGDIPNTITALSGGGGVHYYFSHPGGNIKSKAFGPDYPGLDIEADNGCIIAPPSLHKTREKYRWVEGLEPQCTEMAPLPGWILDQVRKKKTKGRKSQSDQLSQTPVFTKGYRNNSMIRAGGSLHQFCCTETEILQHLMLFNQNRCDPPLPESEVQSVADSAHKYQTGSPADLILAVWIPGFPLRYREKSVLSALIRLSNWKTWKCFPAHKRIGEYAGMGDSSVRRALAVLKEEGFVSWTQTARRSNDYQLHPEKIIHCQTDSKAPLSESTSPLPPPLDTRSYRPTDRECSQGQEGTESLCDSPNDARSDPDSSPIRPDT